MSRKASTAALDQISQRLFLCRHRGPRHPASGLEMEVAFESRMRLRAARAKQKGRLFAGPFCL
jgi:hypothetical protein